MTKTKSTTKKSSTKKKTSTAKPYTIKKDAYGNFVVHLAEFPNYSMKVCGGSVAECKRLCAEWAEKKIAELKAKQLIGKGN